MINIYFMHNCITTTIMSRTLRITIYIANAKHNTQAMQNWTCNYWHCLQLVWNKIRQTLHVRHIRQSSASPSARLRSRSLHIGHPISLDLVYNVSDGSERKQAHQVTLDKLSVTLNKS